MSDPDRILDEFMRAWEAGQTPDPDAYLDRAAPDRQLELSEAIRAYLLVAPEPVYDEATWARLSLDPAAIRAAEMPLGEPEPWASLLPRLRERAGVTWAEVARRLGVSRPERAEEYLVAMERGDHDPMRVTSRALDAIGRILGVPSDALAWRGSQPGPALLRAATQAPPSVDALEVIADMGMTDAGDWDDSDDLFFAGRDER